ncbi:hypothetical protein [Limnohabitans sp.]|nr:hypothetical protein [Limnohabitans sp.]
MHTLEPLQHKLDEGASGVIHQAVACLTAKWSPACTQAHTRIWSQPSDA